MTPSGRYNNHRDPLANTQRKTTGITGLIASIAACALRVLPGSWHQEFNGSTHCSATSKAETDTMERSALLVL